MASRSMSEKPASQFEQLRRLAEEKELQRLMARAGVLPAGIATSVDSNPELLATGVDSNAPKLLAKTAKVASNLLATVVDSNPELIAAKVASNQPGEAKKKVFTRKSDTQLNCRVPKTLKAQLELFWRRRWHHYERTGAAGFA